MPQIYWQTDNDIHYIGFIRMIRYCTVIPIGIENGYTGEARSPKPVQGRTLVVVWVQAHTSRRQQSTITHKTAFWYCTQPNLFTIRSTKTMHTSAKAGFLNFGGDPDPYRDWWFGLPPKFNHLFIGPLPTFRENFMQSRSKFLCKVANRETTTKT